jgi:thiol-disulfide isomerase/thioredoxin
MKTFAAWMLSAAAFHAFVALAPAAQDTRAELVAPPAAKDDKPAPSSPRADSLKTIQDEFQKASAEIAKAIQSGTMKPNENGEYTEWLTLAKKTLKPARELIDADPTDPVALDALIFCLNDLGAGETDPDLYQLVVKHHAASEKVDPLLRRQFAPADFLRSIAAQTPHAKIRVWANYHLADKLYAEGKAKEAEKLAEALQTDETAKDLGGYGSGMLSDTAKRLLFEIRHLSVGQEAPEASGNDIDNKPMKLSDSRGKVTLMVFWATWCKPCMEMVPHERALYRRFGGKPFTIVGVNGDMLPDDKFKITTADGKVIDNSAAVHAAIEKNGIEWRSFRNGTYGIANEWNVRSWPTVYLIDHRGIIRGKWKGEPTEKELDVVVEKLVKAAESDKEKADK